MAEEYRFKDQLKKMGDVSISDPQDGDVLRFDAKDGVWKNVRPSIPQSTVGPAAAGGTLNLHEAMSLSDFAGHVNKFLESVAPSSPPDLSTSSISLTGAAGRVSFGASKPLQGVASVTGVGNLAAVDVDGLLGVDANRRGTVGSIDTISGVLNSDKASTVNYPAAAFNLGSTGALILELNGKEIRRVDLTAPAAVNDANSGFVLSSATPVHFQNGDPYIAKQYRTGSWKVLGTMCRQGWNYVRVRHQINSTTYHDTLYFDFVLDATSGSISFAGELVSSVSLTDAKASSGVKFYTAGKLTYNVTVAGAYANTYNDSEITLTTATPLTSPTLATLPASGGLPNRTYSIVQQIPLGAGRIVGETKVSVHVACPTGKMVDSPGANVQGILYNSQPDTETALIEDFSSESWRLRSDSNFDSLSLVADWDSTQLLSSALAGYRNGLQVAGGRMTYPHLDFSKFGNGPAENANYSSLKGSRGYCRLFKVGIVNNLLLLLEGDGVDFIPVAQSFNGSRQMKVEFKAPSQTGWLDAYTDYRFGKYQDGSGGRRSIDGAGRALGLAWGITLGAKSTGLSNNALCLRLTVPQGFSGYLTRIEVRSNVSQ